MAPGAISPERDSIEPLATLTAKFDDAIRFYLNGTKVVLDEIDPEVTVLEYLRGIGLTGTKLYVISLLGYQEENELTDSIEAAEKVAAAPARSSSLSTTQPPNASTTPQSMPVSHPSHR